MFSSSDTTVSVPVYRAIAREKISAISKVAKENKNNDNDRLFSIHRLNSKELIIL